MKAEELRIGNWVVPSETPFEPVQVTLEGLVYYGDDFIPVLLTEGWLERFGFERNSKTTKYGEIAGDSYIIHISSDTTLRILDDGSYFLEDKHTSFSDDFVLGGIDIKHVHQIQNLYHALTGKEL